MPAPLGSELGIGAAQRGVDRRLLPAHVGRIEAGGEQRAQLGAGSVQEVEDLEKALLLHLVAGKIPLAAEGS